MKTPPGFVAISLRRVLCLFVAVLPGWFPGMLPAAVTNGDPNGRQNLASKSELPSGNGLAAAYPADAGLKTNADVIFADDFESGNSRRRLG